MTFIDEIEAEFPNLVTVDRLARSLEWIRFQSIDDVNLNIFLI